MNAIFKVVAKFMVENVLLNHTLIKTTHGFHLVLNPRILLVKQQIHTTQQSPVVEY